MSRDTNRPGVVITGEFGAIFPHHIGLIDRAAEVYDRLEDPERYKRRGLRIILGILDDDTVQMLAGRKPRNQVSDRIRILKALSKLSSADRVVQPDIQIIRSWDRPHPMRHFFDEVAADFEGHPLVYVGSDFHEHYQPSAQRLERLGFGVMKGVFEGEQDGFQRDVDTLNADGIGISVELWREIGPRIVADRLAQPDAA